MLWGRENALGVPVRWPKSGPPCFRHGGRAGGRARRRWAPVRTPRPTWVGQPEHLCPFTEAGPRREAALRVIWRWRSGAKLEGEVAEAPGPKRLGGCLPHAVGARQPSGEEPGTWFRFGFGLVGVGFGLGLGLGFGSGAEDHAE